MHHDRIRGSVREAHMGYLCLANKKSVYFHSSRAPLSPGPENKKSGKDVEQAIFQPSTENQNIKLGLDT